MIDRERQELRELLLQFRDDFNSHIETADRERQELQELLLQFREDFNSRLATGDRERQELRELLLQFREDINFHFERVEKEVGQVKTELGELKTHNQVFDARLEADRRAQGQVVNLAFALIASATAAVIISAVLSAR